MEMTHMAKRTWIRRTAGSLILSTGLLGCPEFNNRQTASPVDPRPVIGDHTEQRDRNAPQVDEAGITAELAGDGLRVRVPFSGSGVMAALERVNLRVLVVDGQTEEERGTATLTQQGLDPAELTITPAQPLFTHADGFGAMGRYILVVEASGHAGTTRVRRDLFRLLNYLDVTLVAPKSAASAGTFVLRATVKDQRGAGGANEQVTGVLKGADGAVLQQLNATTDANGEVSLTFTAPDDGSASVQVALEVGPGGNRGRWEGSVALAQSKNVLLTTDKPRYQPGQMMHLRALVFQGAQRTPYEGPVVFEVQDAKGNTLFKQEATANSHGVASAQFRVGKRVNEGTWKTRVGLGADGRGAPVARQVTVEKYVLPRFKVEVNAAAAQLRPGENTLITVHAGYTFGVALNGGSARLQASVKGQLVMDQVSALNSTGDAQFTVAAPSTPDGRAAPLDISVEVTDSAGGVSTGTRQVNVVPLGAVVTTWWAQPAGNVGGRNTLYALLTDAAGTPVAGSVRLQGYNNAGTETRVVDAHGLAAFELTGLTSGSYLNVEGLAGGASSYGYINAPSGSAGLGVETLEGVVDEGGALTISVSSARAAPGAATVDVYAGGSLSQSLTVTLGANGAGTAVLSPVPGGLLRLVAREHGTGSVGEGAAYARMDRTLRVGITAAAASYRPRDTAQVRVAVTNKAGAGVASAVGLTVVDEAVYALSDVSGPVKAFTEGDSVDAPQGMVADDVLGTVTTDGERGRARAVLSFGANAGGLLRADLGEATRTRARTEANSMVNRDATDIGRAAQEAGVEPWNTDGLDLLTWLHAQQFNDPWGNPYRVSDANSSSYYAQLLSNGADEVAGNADDLTGYVYVGGGWGFGDAERDGVAGAGGPPQNAGQPAPAPECEGANCGTPDPNTNAPRTNVVRREFPETLLVQPMVITDPDGVADVELPLADSITSWRVGAVASDRTGRMGVGTGDVRVFQDFFVDLDVPSVLTEGDEVAITAVINNFLPEPQLVTITADTGTWGTVLAGGNQTISVPAVSVTGAVIRIKAVRVGEFPLAIRAQGQTLADALVRSVRVGPSGDEKPFSVSDRLRDVAAASVIIPQAATPGATELQVRITPGVQAEVVTGLDSMVRMPSGCFEQTSSSNYPNTLILAYVRSTGQSMPEVEAKARTYLQEGYQRLVSYEVTGGGFSWFGEAPAHNVLTAYGLMQFVDMAAVFPVDQGVITRTATWLVGEQKADGHFEPTAGGIAEGAIDAYQRNNFRTTAFLAWALQRAGGQTAAVERAITWLRGEAATQTDPYALAVYVNLLAAVGSEHPDLGGAVNALLAVARDTDGATSFVGAPPSNLAPCGGSGSEQTDLEVTALAAHGLIMAGVAGDVASRSLTYLVRNKDSFGSWQSTQATIRSLQALLASLGTGSEPAQSNVRVLLDGEQVAVFDIAPNNANVTRVVDLSERATPGTHIIDVLRSGTGNFQFQVAGRAFVPRAVDAAPRIRVTTAYSTLTPAVGEAVTVTANVETMESFEQVMVDVGIPPGFDVELDLLDAARTAGLISRAEIQGSRLHVYAPKALVGTPLSLSWRIRPRLSAAVTAPPVKAYAYYDPKLGGESAPVLLTVP